MGENTDDAGDRYILLDRFGRIVDQRWRKGDGSHTDRFGYGYDRDGNRLYRENAVNTAFSELYHAGSGYDGFNQLTSFARGQLNASKDGIVSGTLKRQIDWTFDALGNWTQTVTTVPPGSPVTRTRGHNKQNQLTSISAPEVTPGYDYNGNTIMNEKGRGLVYDGWDRLVEVKTSPTGTRLVRYTYDGLGRRVCETTGGQTGENLCVATGGTRRDFYQSKDWQVVEERLGGAVKAHYVWSLAYVDGLVLRDRNNDASPDLEERLYVQQDANWNVTAAVNTSGGVAERSVYDPYGKPTFVHPTTWAALSGSTVAWQYLHQGGRYHDFGDGTGLYHFRNRELTVTLGRWIRPDPLGFGAGDSNLYRYVGENPINALDPTGKDCPGCDIPPAVFGAQANDSACVRACCAQHDKCYYDNKCTGASWCFNVAGGAGGGALGTFLGAPWLGGTLGVAVAGMLSTCAQCNNEIAACILACSVTGMHMAGNPEYFCAKTGEFITVGPQLNGNRPDYESIDEAKKACCSDRPDPPPGDPVGGILTIGNLFGNPLGPAFPILGQIGSGCFGQGSVYSCW